MTISEILGSFGITILGGLTGHNYIQINRLREKMPEAYRSKEDCKAICIEFRDIAHHIDRKMEEGFNRIYDKLDQKEDKG